MKFVINPGHGKLDSGGYDPGAVGKVKKLEEAKVVKEIGEALASELRSFGHEAHTIQDGDLADVTDYANSIKPDLFISIHTNSVVHTSANGIETYALAPGGTGEHVAGYVQRELVAKLGLQDRKVKFAQFWVLRKTIGYPAILVELGFISNAKEEELLSQSEFRKKAAHAIFVGLMKAYNLPYENEKVKPKTYGVWYQGEDDKGGANRVALKVRGTALPRRSYTKGMYNINIMVGGTPVNEPNHINLTGKDWVETMKLVIDLLEGRIKYD